MPEENLAGDWKGHLPRHCFSLSLDSDQKDQLIEVIEKLLADKTTVSALWEDRTEAGPSFSVFPLTTSYLASPAGGGQCSDGL